MVRIDCGQSNRQPRTTGNGSSTKVGRKMGSQDIQQEVATSTENEYTIRPRRPPYMKILCTALQIHTQAWTILAPGCKGEEEMREGPHTTGPEGSKQAANNTYKHLFTKGHWGIFGGYYWHLVGTQDAAE